MIEFEGVAKIYEGHREALSDVNFRLAPGEMAFLTGQSGAGKSTLLRLILGLEKSSSGIVRVISKVRTGISAFPEAWRFHNRFCWGESGYPSMSPIAGVRFS